MLVATTFVCLIARAPSSNGRCMVFQIAGGPDGIKLTALYLLTAGSLSYIAEYGWHKPTGRQQMVDTDDSMTGDRRLAPRNPMVLKT